jgi:hypothetical protein
VVVVRVAEVAEAAEILLTSFLIPVREWMTKENLYGNHYWKLQLLEQRPDW